MCRRWPSSSTRHAAGSAPARSPGLMRAAAGAAGLCSATSWCRAGPGKCRRPRRRSCHGPRVRAPPPSTCPPASTGSSVQRRRRAPARALALTCSPEAMVAVSARAGMPVWIPRRTSPGTAARFPGHRRATPRAPALMANRTVAALWRWSGEGELPVVIDASSCSHGLASELATPQRGEPASATRSWRSSTRSPGQAADPEPCDSGEARVGRRPPDLLNPAPGARA